MTTAGVSGRGVRVLSLGAWSIPLLIVSVGLPLVAGALLDGYAGVALGPEVRDRIVAATGGHPLGLIELPRFLGAAQLTGAEP